MNRRALLRGVAAGTATLMSFVLPDWGNVMSAATSAPGPRPGETDPTFASGTVIARELAGLVVSYGAGQRAVRVSPATEIWKETDVDYSNVELGDTVHVSGLPLADGSLQAKSIWVNIGRFDGEIQAVLPDRVSILTARHQQHWTVEFSPYLEVVHPSGAPLAGHTSALKAGQRVGGVVVRRRDGTRRATRIWVF